MSSVSVEGGVGSGSSTGGSGEAGGPFSVRPHGAAQVLWPRGPGNLPSVSQHVESAGPSGPVSSQPSSRDSS